MSELCRIGKEPEPELPELNEKVYQEADQQKMRR
jgi:hypothetical protein